MSKKLIEVRLPLQAINRESARDKNLSAGHPTTLHYWWAARPLPACRAVVFASLVDDPSSRKDLFPDQESQDRERTRLLDFVEKLCRWESHRDPSVLDKAHQEIMASVGTELPTVYDPFCGRGLIPLEAQRLGLETVASDYNPVPVTIAKTLLEIVPRFLHVQPVNPQSRQGALVGGPQPGEGFTADIEYYAARVLETSRSKVGQFFPKYAVTAEQAAGRPDLRRFVGKTLTPLGWLSARTVRCSNPACGFDIPLVGSFWLSQKQGRRYWLEPVADDSRKRIAFRIGHGSGSAPPPTKMPGTGATFKCPACGELSGDRYLEEQGRAGRIGRQLMCVIADGGRSVGRVYLPPREDDERAGRSAMPEWIPDVPIPDYSQAMPTITHGVSTWADMFTPRQLLVLDTLAQAIRELRDAVERDAAEAGMEDDGRPLPEGGKGARAYADAITTFLGMALGKQANRTSAFCFWHTTGEKVEQPFAQQGIQKSWDFVESNPFGDSSGSWIKAVEYPLKVVKETYSRISPAHVFQADAANVTIPRERIMVITDPPYYDNVGYADLSDFFYIWLRRALPDVYPTLFGTVLTPKAHELAAVKHRFAGNKSEAERSFVDGFRAAFRNLAGMQHEDFPLCLFYAYKQKENRSGAKEVSTGWDTMLNGLLDAGLMVTATWPVLSESVETMKKNKASLSTSIVLVCRKRPANAQTITRREFISLLKKEMPEALRALQAGSIAPVDLAQSAIGPGMAVFSRHARVLEADGSSMTVRVALALINEALDEVLAQQEGEFDPDTRWAVGWYQQYGLQEGPYGEAETLCKAKNISVRGLQEAGLVVTKANRVRLIPRTDLASEWNPTQDTRLTVWDVTQQLIRAVSTEGEQKAAAILQAIGPRAEAARDLAYRLFSVAERKGWTDEAIAYNSLIASWPHIAKISQSAGPGVRQTDLGF